jgi:hypothetical protein
MGLSARKGRQRAENVNSQSSLHCPPSLIMPWMMTHHAGVIARAQGVDDLLDQLLDLIPISGRHFPVHEPLRLHPIHQLALPTRITSPIRKMMVQLSSPGSLGYACPRCLVAVRVVMKQVSLASSFRPDVTSILYELWQMAAPAAPTTAKNHARF